MKDSSFNFRVTQNTEVDIAGPLKGNALAITKYSPTGTSTRGTLNNCGTGKTPWNSLFVGRRELVRLFHPRGQHDDDAARGNDKSVVSLKRYGRDARARPRAMAGKPAAWKINTSAGTTGPEAAPRRTAATTTATR